MVTPLYAHPFGLRIELCDKFVEAKALPAWILEAKCRKCLKFGAPKPRQKLLASNSKNLAIPTGAAADSMHIVKLSVGIARDEATKVVGQ